MKRRLSAVVSVLAAGAAALALAVTANAAAGHSSSTTAMHDNWPAIARPL